MRKKILVFIVALLIAGGLFSNPIDAVDWRFPVGLTYINGFGDVTDIYKDNMKAEGYMLLDESWDIPVGISFHPYVELDNGITIGTGFGPLAAIFVTTSSSGGGDGDKYFFDFPVNLTGGYVFIPSANISPYVRGGVMYHIASGDYVESSTPGLFGAVGVEFFRHNPVGLGIEIGYDSSEIELEKVGIGTEEIEPFGLMVSIFAIF
jgi:hypothetical protein